uniref:heme-binding protein n=1 Tax=Sinorhizobium sp. KGO-5 TaxID=1470810 RepID=UPI0030C779CF
MWKYCKPGAPAHNLEASNGGLAPFAGGLPIHGANGAMIGAIGVSRRCSTARPRNRRGRGNRAPWLTPAFCLFLTVHKGPFHDQNHSHHRRWLRFR